YFDGTSAGKSVRSPRDSRLRAGGSGDSWIRRAEPRIRVAQHPADSHLEHVHAVAAGADWHNVPDRTVAGRAAIAEWTNLTGRIDCVQRVRDAVGMADDCARVGDEYFPARCGVDGPAQLHPDGRATD